MKVDKSLPVKTEFSQFLLYKTPNEKVKVEIYLHNENIWLTQKKIGELFGVDFRTVSEHLKNIFESKELVEYAVLRKFRSTAEDGKSYIMNFYSLDAIISVGYRVNSVQATQFRIWATQRLHEYILKGFTMDDERLKDPTWHFGKDYFEEQLARIRNIRSSERRMYQKITDIYSQCSADYDPDQEVTRLFFATVQNKLHFAITGLTAAEIVYTRVGSGKKNLGLTNWKGFPKGMIRETDVTTAKNYLNETELDELNRIVEMYLGFAEMQAKRGVIMYMKDWVEKLNAFLKFNEREILENNGKISHEVAEELALGEYEKYRVRQDVEYVSDFDREVLKILPKGKVRKIIKNKK